MLFLWFQKLFFDFDGCRGKMQLGMEQLGLAMEIEYKEGKMNNSNTKIVNFVTTCNRDIFRRILYLSKN